MKYLSDYLQMTAHKLKCNGESCCVKFCKFKTNPHLSLLSFEYLVERCTDMLEDLKKIKIPQKMIEQFAKILAWIKGCDEAQEILHQGLISGMEEGRSSPPTKSDNPEDGADTG